MVETLEVVFAETALGDPRIQVTEQGGETYEGREFVFEGPYNKLHGDDDELVACDDILTLTAEEGHTFTVAKFGDTVKTRIVENHEPQEYSVPYQDAYNVSEKVHELGFPDDDDTTKQLRYMPHVNLIVEHERGGDIEPVGVEINGERHDL